MKLGSKFSFSVCKTLCFCDLKDIKVFIVCILIAVTLKGNFACMINVHACIPVFLNDCIHTYIHYSTCSICCIFL